MTTYALVHGAWHSGWHWHAVVDLLTEHGHRAVAPDLPIGDPSAGAQAWADATVQAIGDDTGRVVVVGHAMGALAVPLVAAARPVARMVFVAGMPPTLGMAAKDSIPGAATTERFKALTRRLETFPDGSTRWSSLTDAAEAMYDELPRGVALVAASHLRRQYYPIWDEVSPLSEWPDVPSSYVVCSYDQVLDAEWARQVSRDLLGLEPVEFPSGHSPFLSRPAELATLLLQLTEETVSV